MLSAVEVRKGLGTLAVAAIAITGLSLVTTSAAHAEKTAAQIKCEEDGGTWVDKGEGHTFCFKKLPPMSRGNPSHGSGGTGAAQGSSQEAARMRQLKPVASEAEARIAKSTADKSALLAAKTDAEARAVLLRNGFTQEQLAGVPVTVRRNGVAGGTAGAARVKVDVEVSCCPVKIVIVIRF